MANVRLRVNLISDGKFFCRGSLIDEALIPEHLREHIDRDLENREGSVLLLRDVSFHSVPKPGADGIPTSYPVHLAAGELLELARVPASQRAFLKEGEDYKIEWSEAERDAARKAEEEAFLAQFQPKPAPAFRHGSL